LQGLSQLAWKVLEPKRGLFGESAMVNNEKNNNPQLGRIRPFVLALFIIVLSLLLHNWWWKIGAIIMIILFIEAYFRYRGIER
jgi:hypothetical protein